MVDRRAEVITSLLTSSQMQSMVSSRMSDRPVMKKMALFVLKIICLTRAAKGVSYQFQIDRVAPLNDTWTTRSIGCFVKYQDDEAQGPAAKSVTV
jgi:hypothetical protein